MIFARSWAHHFFVWIVFTINLIQCLDSLSDKDVDPFFSLVGSSTIPAPEPVPETSEMVDTGNGSSSKSFGASLINFFQGSTTGLLSLVGVVFVFFLIVVLCYRGGRRLYYRQKTFTTSFGDEDFENEINADVRLKRVVTQTSPVGVTIDNESDFEADFSSIPSIGSQKSHSPRQPSKKGKKTKGNIEIRVTSKSVQQNEMARVKSVSSHESIRSQQSRSVLVNGAQTNHQNQQGQTNSLRMQSIENLPSPVGSAMIRPASPVSMSNHSFASDIERSENESSSSSEAEIAAITAFVKQTSDVLKEQQKLAKKEAKRKRKEARRKRREERRQKKMKAAEAQMNHNPVSSVSSIVSLKGGPVGPPALGPGIRHSRDPSIRTLRAQAAHRQTIALNQARSPRSHVTPGGGGNNGMGLNEPDPDDTPWQAGATATNDDGHTTKGGPSAMTATATVTTRDDKGMRSTDMGPGHLPTPGAGPDPFDRYVDDDARTVVSSAPSAVSVASASAVSSNSSHQIEEESESHGSVDELFT